jgi:hypothetical protein
MSMEAVGDRPGTSLGGPECRKDVLLLCGVPQYYSQKDVMDLLEQWGPVKDVCLSYQEYAGTTAG